ncbi:hypothetical protein DL93DRAFT_2078005 [Clavulina sp. PMI_390]|nr:hypothetical protein DL93DRAFT_2078005 [Clavulina sp. PMI_390]
MSTDPFNGPHSQEVNAISLWSIQTGPARCTSDDVIQSAQILSSEWILTFTSGLIERHPRAEELARFPSQPLPPSDMKGFWRQACCENSQGILFSPQPKIPFPHFRCWRFGPHSISTKSITAKLVTGPLDPQLVSVPHSVSPNSEFKLNPTQFPVMQQSPAMSGPSFQSPIIPELSDGTVRFKHRGYRTGHSTLLSRVRMRVTDQEVLVLSHAPRSGGNRGRGPQPEPWETQYKVVHLEDHYGALKAPTRANLGRLDFNSGFLWSEWTGQIVIASESVAGMVTIGVYQM